MTLCSNWWTLEQISAAISIATPITLLFWFYYSQKQNLSKNYYDEIDGIYAGFTDAIGKSQHNGRIYGGIIMNVRDIDNKGFFKGEFDFGETEMTTQNERPIAINLMDGVFTFLGKLNYRLYLNKTRHPFKPTENRTYLGKLYIVDRLDFSFGDYKIEDYLSAEYDIIHYREMQTMKFTLSKVYKSDRPELPKSFVLYKSVGFEFEPYKNVKQTVFRETRADK